MTYIWTLYTLRPVKGNWCWFPYPFDYIEVLFIRDLIMMKNVPWIVNLISEMSNGLWKFESKLIISVLTKLQVVLDPRLEIGMIKYWIWISPVTLDKCVIIIHVVQDINDELWRWVSPWSSDEWKLTVQVSSCRVNHTDSIWVFHMFSLNCFRDILEPKWTGGLCSWQLTRGSCAAIFLWLNLSWVWSTCDTSYAYKWTPYMILLCRKTRKLRVI